MEQLSMYATLSLHQAFHIPFPLAVHANLLHNIRYDFQGTTNRQLDGMAMGSPLGPTLAVFLSMRDEVE